MDATDSKVDISYELVEVAKISDLTPGTQIAVKGSYKDLHPILKFLYPLFSSDEYYFHHGVYLGECTVAHFSGTKKTDAKPRRCDIFEFIRGSVGEKYIGLSMTIPLWRGPLKKRYNARMKR